MGKILQIFLQLNFIPNNLGCYGLNEKINKKLVLKTAYQFRKTTLLCTVIFSR